MHRDEATTRPYLAKDYIIDYIFDSAGTFSTGAGPTWGPYYDGFLFGLDPCKWCTDAVSCEKNGKVTTIKLCKYIQYCRCYNGLVILVLMQ
jgi:hypothetical protein